ncbi:MAG: hypothetical protein OEW34_14730, partial [Burkholderiaceae bacterium]|nr:hypothetical protein [Burkholderiaceae bacterium]
MRTAWVMTSALAAVLASSAGTVAAQAPAKASMPKICTTCHQPEAGAIRGNFENVAFKSQAIQLSIDDR